MELIAVADTLKEDIMGFIHDFESGKENFVFNTSGSTGKPKQILIKRKQLIDSALLTQQALALKRGYHAFICLNTHFIAGKMMLIRCIITGMKATIVPASSNPFADLKGDEAFDFAAFVPFQIYHLLNGKDAAKNLDILNRMKTIIVGGENIGYELLQQLQQIKAPVYHTFGMTETVSHFALKRLNGLHKQDTYHLLPQIEIGTDERSCLMVKSPVTEDHWIITNDLVDILNDNEFLWKGRIDHVINTGGIKVQIEEIEKIVERVFFEMKIPNRFIITGVPDQALGEKVVLIIEGTASLTPSFDKILNLLRDNLTKYEWPKEIRLLSKFEETATRKIDRRKTVGLKYNQ